MQEDDQRSLEELESSIDRAKEKEKQKHQATERSGSSQAMHIGLELVAGVVVGCVAGIYLDKWLGTSPVFFFVCFGLGIAGGWMNMMRFVKKMNKEDEDNKDNE